ncbi:conserved hypothetical protein [Lodderomyces elongisporus NRRL YB-4239]|uniref:Transcriptional regulatory protein n=1 Tax=Lodderomyces elongisporus (strain ATCC 11503 / CBS 2605 / JCM 1781 / NBRC 1676 / NRRL YB-4239) TaxID=379508 RepID=A5DUI9_LODEL|nr:conserved hypothetical protein [Lodderomyces elongisporus NRRL YB-4239]
MFPMFGQITKVGVFRLNYRLPLASYQGLRFAGHSKWSNIRHDKAKNDAKKSKEATLISDKIASCVRTGGVDGNANLESLIERAKKLNVSKTVIQGAIKRGSGNIDNSLANSEVSYEFMGPHGIAMIVSAVTDNKARTVMRVKSALQYFSASMSPCNYMFEKKGEILFKPKDMQNVEEFDHVMDMVIELGAEDIEEFDFEDEVKPDVVHKIYRLICDPMDIHQISNELGAKGYKIHDSSIRSLANPDVEVEFPEADSKGFLKAIDALDQTPEVTDYFTNIKDEHETRIKESLN